MSLVQKQSYNAECDLCHELDESSETGAPWYYDSAKDAFARLRDNGWTVDDHGRLLCSVCIDNGRELPPPACTCVAGRGTNPGCPVCP